MIGHLSQVEIEDLLRNQVVGRLGCQEDDLIYIVPMSYAYDGDNIYCHSYEGKKVKLMRKNPKVCFQVDEMKDMANWKSVIVWGEFEELKDEDEKDQALKMLLERVLPLVSSVTTHLGETWPFSVANGAELNRIPGVVFRISPREKTGKYERTSKSPLMSFD